jgi:predicted XRE-type DNA-binding protein
MNNIESYNSVWDAISDTPGEAANLQAKCELMRKIVEIIELKKWTQAEAAKHCGITQPRINDLLRGRISKFSLDALVNIAASTGQKVHIKLEAAA